MMVMLWVMLSAMPQSQNNADNKTREQFLVYYAEDLSLNDLEPYSLLVFDSRYHPSLNPLLDRQKILLGYLSLGEVNKDRPYFQQVKDMGLLLQENPNWAGSFMVDIRRPEWAALVVEELIPNILRQGFSGLFMDTLDNPFWLETKDPQRFKGMGQAAIDLVRQIRIHYPEMKIMLNRAYPALTRIGDTIDMFLAESMYSDYNFESKTYGKVDSAEYQRQLNILNQARSLYPKLAFYSLDYWDPRDTKTIKEIYRIQRAAGLTPYVATVLLNELVKEPQ